MPGTNHHSAAAAAVVCRFLGMVWMLVSGLRYVLSLLCLAVLSIKIIEIKDTSRRDGEVVGASPTKSPWSIRRGR